MAQSVMARRRTRQDDSSIMLISILRTIISACDGTYAVDLTLSEEQKQLVDSFAALYARASTSQMVRAAEPLGFDPKLWRALRVTGLLEMAVPEEAGGWGASVADLALTAE